MSEYCKNCFELAEKLAKKEQECEELKEKLYQIEDVVKPINEQLPEDSVIRQIMLILNDCNKLEPSHYRKALEEIGGYCNKKREKWCTEKCVRSAGFCIERNCYPIRDLTYILDIINKVRGGEDE